MESSKALATLHGEELNSVAFVMDYVEFGFNGPVLRSLSNPKVNTGLVEKKFPEESSRDTLCSLIGATVVNCQVQEGEFIKITFEGKRWIEIPLDDSTRIGPEAAHFHPADKSTMYIW